jgi:hypothetical protein
MDAWVRTPLKAIATEIVAAQTLAATSWAEGSIALVVAFKKLRENMSPDLTPATWIKEQPDIDINEHDCSALISLSLDVEAARKMFARSISRQPYSALLEAFNRRGRPNGKSRKRNDKKLTEREVSRLIRLADELPKIKDTSLDHPGEKDALITLKQLDPNHAEKLISRAANGEAVSAQAEIDKREFKQRPTAKKLEEVFNRHSQALLRAWTRATPDERRVWLKTLEERADV